MYRRCDRLWGKLTLGSVIFQSVFFSLSSQYDGRPDWTHGIYQAENYCGTGEIHWSARLGQRESTAQDAQKGCPARPQRARRRRRTLRYVELLSDARTLLADFFSILL
jgi:hypothetical protein